MRVNIVHARRKASCQLPVARCSNESLGRRGVLGSAFASPRQARNRFVALGRAKPVELIRRPSRAVGQRMLAR